MAKKKRRKKAGRRKRGAAKQSRRPARAADISAKSQADPARAPEPRAPARRAELDLPPRRARLPQATFDPALLAKLQLKPVARTWHEGAPIVRVLLDERPIPGPLFKPGGSVPAPVEKTIAKRRLLDYGAVCGASVGLALFTPAMAVALFLMAHLKLGSSTAGLSGTLAVTAGFVGLPSLLIVGTIGRTSARARLHGARFATLVRVAAGGTAAVGAGLCIVAAAVLGHVGQELEPWLTAATLGAVVGLASGMLIAGLIARYRAPLS